MTKKLLRLDINMKIDQMTPEQRQKESQAICQKISESAYWAKAKTILLFLSFGNEISIDSLVETAVTQNKITAIPYCFSQGKMDFYPVSTLAPELFKLNKWGIREPQNRKDPLYPDEKTLIIVPGTAFTPDGKRLGKGGGYYDRYLAQYPQAKTLGIGYSCQLVYEIPTEPHDKKLDRIFTP